VGGVVTITEQDRVAFRERGCVVVPGVLNDAQLAVGRELAAAMLAVQPPEPGHVGPHFLWPQFDAAGHPLLEFYASIGLGRLAAQLVRPGLDIEQPVAAQLATTIPRWPHRPGGPHVDGITPVEPDGRPGTFTMLAGVWLSDQREPDRGNLYVWPGTHLRFGAYLAERGADELVRVHDEARANPAYPDIELGDPEQVTGPAGSVLLAHYLLGHNIGGHSGPADSASRVTIYYRLRATGHTDRWRDTVINPLLEFA
jgi:hypothetical protein